MRRNVSRTPVGVTLVRTRVVLHIRPAQTSVGRGCNRNNRYRYADPVTATGPPSVTPNVPELTDTARRVGAQGFPSGKASVSPQVRFAGRRVFPVRSSRREPDWRGEAISVVDVTEILIHWHAGRSQREIATSLGVDRKTVKKYVRPAIAA